MNKFIKIFVLVPVFVFLSFSITSMVFAEPENTSEGCTEVSINDLSGSVDGASATLHVPAGACPVRVSFSSYEHAGTIVPFEAQILTDNITDTYGPGSHEIGELDIACNWQTDLYLGNTQEHLIPNVGHTDLIAYDFAENQDCEEENLYCADGVKLTPIEFQQAISEGAITYTHFSKNEGETQATFTINNNTGCIMPVSMSSYEMYESTPVLSTQVLFDLDDSAINSSEEVVNLVVDLPTCSAQIDVWYGLAPTTLLDSNPYGDPSRDPHVFDYGYARFGDPFCSDSEPTATISATKIVCDAEADLPNWGLGGPDITATTASTFLAEHANCHQVEWTFEWAPEGTSNPGNNVETGGSAWTTFTNTTHIPVEGLVWVREQFDADYIPFVGDGNASNVSAELYCSNDVLNYDNFDFINPVVDGETYHCIGFNVLKTVDHPQCSDGVDNADTEDTLVDSADPGCHTDGNASNADSYVPTDNDETDVVLPQCSDNIDNADTEDTLIDELDPGCHTDGDVGNDDSYDPDDNNETDEDLPECSDGLDNDRDGRIDYPKDKGCRNPEDDNEKNSSGGGGYRKPKPPVGEVLGEQTSCGIYVKEYLRIGYNNDVTSVVKVQSFLNNYMDAGLVTDGIYGPLTEAAVRNFQLAHADKILKPWNLSEPTGIFYLTTQTEVNNIMCPDLNLSIPTNLIPFGSHSDTPDRMPGTTSFYLDISNGSVLGDQYPGK